MITLPQACRDPQLFAPWFRDPETWGAWLVFMRALFALPMTDADLATYRACTGRTKPPSEPVTEGWLICGRRAGKSFTLALVAAFLAAFYEWRPFLSPGERATIMVIAADRRQARVIMRYIRAFFDGVTMLKAMVERETTEGLDLNNQVTIEVHSASFRTVRGYTIVAALLDEVAYWRSDEGSANPDAEIIAALKPAMATIPASMLLCASSPYARRGALWDAYKRHYGKDGQPLVWQADTRTMNCTVPQTVIAEAYEADPAAASAEFGAQFRSDVVSFVAREAIEDCVELGRRELAPLPGVGYRAFIDPSGGSSDSMTLAIGHRTGDQIVIDCLRERVPPFSPDAVVEDFAAVLRSYGLGSAVGDKYAGLWPTERFRDKGIFYSAAARPKSELYAGLLPLLNSNRIEVLDHPRLIAQLGGLERKTSRAGKDTIDHGPGGHDDVVNVVAGVASLLSQPIAQRRMIRIRG